MDLKLQVRKTIQEENLIKEGSNVLLGLSGGPDSVCLLSILCDLQRPLHFKLYALHVNHSIRGRAADNDEKYAKNICESLNIPFKSVKIDVPSLAKKQNKTEEEMGRIVRYSQLQMYADEIDAESIALAHNKNDQAETVLMRIIRGTGVHGLCGMEIKRPDGIIRPLLKTSREEIENYCKEKNLKPRIDKTNSETDYTRNKIRLELLPELKKEFNPAIMDALVRLSESAKEDDASLNLLAKEHMTNSIKALAKMDDALFARVIYEQFKQEGLTEDISSVHINSLRKAVLKNVGGKVIEFPNKYKAVLKDGKVKIYHG
ncbi:MAG: tRNA lysidine(34) synthetase TilS [Bacillota bacterium]|nr:tRNA lysidine(34) synthetase TilS [Bacillota bacterium]